MLCATCSKLAFLVTKRICVRCGMAILNNLSVICDYCSNNDRVCSVCLKKIQSPSVLRNRGCGRCGK